LQLSVHGAFRLLSLEVGIHFTQVPLYLVVGSLRIKGHNMVAYIGDRSVKWRRLGSRSIQMSTAIARIYTPEGFVIAADGRKTRSGDPSGIIRDSQQKIFSIEQPGRRLAYAFAGAVELTHRDSDKVLFDFVAETDRAVINLSAKAPRSLWHYAEMLIDALTESINDVRRGPDALDPSIENSRTHLFISGFYGKHPKSVCIDFINHVQEESEAELNTEELSELYQYGSKRVLDLLREGDPSFGTYVTSEQKRKNATLHEAVEIACRDIRAQCGPAALKIDERTCSAIGGHIHIATVTFVGGFQWVRGFEPVTDPIESPDFGGA
jgi:hypothetical protein